MIFEKYGTHEASHNLSEKEEVEKHFDIFLQAMKETVADMERLGPDGFANQSAVLLRIVPKDEQPDDEGILAVEVGGGTLIHSDHINCMAESMVQMAFKMADAAGYHVAMNRDETEIN